MKIIDQLKRDLEFYRGLKPGRSIVGVLLDPCFLVCANYRLTYWAARLDKGTVGKLLRFSCMLTDRFVSTLAGTVIRSGALIGERFQVHNTVGIIIADGVVIGDDCTIFAGVCIVNKANGRGEGQPKIGNKVMLGVGCKIIGHVTIGDNVIVGANAVVLRDVPSNCMAVGVPTRNRPMSSETKVVAGEAEEG